MPPYKKVDVSEQTLEDLIRRFTDCIEAGLKYVDRQITTDGGRLDVLMADSGKSLVVAELKVVESDDMLLHGQEVGMPGMDRSQRPREGMGRAETR